MVTNFISYFDAFFLALVEGITEFLPVSSTGHLIISRDLLGLNNHEFADSFIVIIQGGAILAVVTLFWKTFLNWCRGWYFLVRGSGEGRLVGIQYVKESLFIFMSVIPFGVLGFLFKTQIKSLFSIHVVASSLIIGGILLIAEQFMKQGEKVFDSSTSSFRDCLIIGFSQCLAFWPGFSRSAATILSARFLGYSSASAAKISFLIGFPTLLGVSGYESLKIVRDLDPKSINILVFGIILSWIVSFLSAKFLISFLQTKKLAFFGYYRVILGLILIFFFNG